MSSKFTHKLYVFSSSKETVHKIDLSIDNEYHFGSDPTCAIQFTSKPAKVQARHCHLFFDKDQGRWMIRRHNDTCEVLVGGQKLRIMESVLRSNTVIRVGGKEFKLTKNSKRRRTGVSSSAAEDGSQRKKRKANVTQIPKASSGKMDNGKTRTTTVSTSTRVLSSKSVECQTAESTIAQEKNPNRFVDQVLNDIDFVEHARNEIRHQLEEKLRKEYEIRLKKHLEQQVAQQMKQAMQQQERQLRENIALAITRSFGTSFSTYHHSSPLDDANAMPKQTSQKQHVATQNGIPSPLRATQSMKYRLKGTMRSQGLFTTSRQPGTASPLDDGGVQQVDASNYTDTEYPGTPHSKVNEDSEHDGSPIRLDFLTEEELQLIFKSRDALYNKRS
uniref:FHA domain-containing protein n=1 Tax=Percolomonas cosmopolitus TaxID=63605 RepID=A0A7S1PFE5_9EUKA|eukprot:CAMPEP_0117440126 /NCGR_PEP_ID=MMETSP0759-20121206/2919_1 /TAXON_ID=63605 /ORGANISM="Percolomonas cosmopolitus, Strain WS" /LENGTH=387 /DNA_ID=CAMNT_0005231861 /DNA_START=29 /DNA_END=1192 /DNA_ORIENTATION=+